MKLDGRFEPLTALAQAAALTTVLIVWASHEVKRRFRTVDSAAQRAHYESLVAGREITGPRSHWRY